ncbi:MAG TPA: hypothetical protein VIK64_17465 [Anaerolineales bacterium]|jgi:hypothetical protein
MNELRDRIFAKVTRDMDPFKRIVQNLPGFKGYLERQTRRDSDKLIRDVIFQRFRELEGHVSRIQRDFISQGQIGYVDDLERGALKIRTFADKVRTASRGYSGLFDAVNVNEQEIARLYEYDAAMLELADEVERAIDNVEASVGTDGLPAAIRHLETTADLCIETFERREEVILES